jgi:hypothetical protein
MEKMSIKLAERIKDTESEIGAREACLAAIAQEKAALLGAPVMDTKSLQRLDTEEQKATAAITSLATRITLLKEQVEEAERAEAGARVHALEAEHALVRLRLESQHLAWTEGIMALLVILKENGEDKAQVRLLADEANYLHERYGVAHATLPAVPFLSRDDLTIKLTDEFRKGAWAMQVTSRWKERTDALRRQKNAVVHAAAEEQRKHRRARGMVKMSTPSFVMGKQQA